MALTKIRLIRIKGEKTIREIAKEIGMSETELIKIDNGRMWVPTKWRSPLANALGITADEIIDPATGLPVFVNIEE